MENNNGGKALAITAVSYALLVGAAVLFVQSQPDVRADIPCRGLCFTPRTQASLMLYGLGFPAFLVSFLISVVILAPHKWRTRSPYLVGTLASVAPVVLTCLLLAGSAIGPEPEPRPSPSPKPQVTHCIPISGGRGCPGG